VGAQRERDDLGAIGDRERILHNVERVRLRLEGLEGGPNILRSPYLKGRNFEVKCASRSLNLASLWRGWGLAALAMIASR
jgi:hypothetical protein